MTQTENPNGKTAVPGLDVQQFVDKLRRQQAEQSGSSQAASSDASTSYECEKCHDFFFLAVLPDGARAAIDSQEALHAGYSTVAECKCQWERRQERLFKSSRITEQFRSVGFKGFITKGRPKCVRDALDIALAYYNEFEKIRDTRNNSIALLGPPGSGKTHLLMAVCNGLLRKEVGVHYFPWVEGFGDLKDNLDELEPRLDVMRQVDVLFIDDLFKGRTVPTDFQLEQLFSVVNYRYLECKPMLISSERDIDAICAIDEGVGRRIWERAKGHRAIMGLTEEEAKAGMTLNYSLL